MTRKPKAKQATAPIPPTEPKPLVEESEALRTARSTKNYFMTPEEMAPIIARAEAKNVYSRFNGPQKPMMFQKPQGKKRA